MGSRGEPARTDLRIGGGRDGAGGGAPGMRGIGGGDSPPPSRAIGSSKKPRSTVMGSRRGKRVWKIRVPRPEFRSSSSAETPMSCKQGRETAGTVSGSNSPRVVFLQFPLQSALGADGEPRPTDLPDFGIGAKADGAHGDGRGTMGSGGGESPPPLGTVGGSKEPPIEANASGAGWCRV